MRIIGGIDPERIWVDLCENQPAAKAKCQLFLKHYVESSTEVNSGLDLESNGNEYRSVNAASTVDLVWKDLVGHANDVVLRKKRAEDPENAWRWTVKYTDVKQGKLCGPVSQITNVCLLGIPRPRTRPQACRSRRPACLVQQTDLWSSGSRRPSRWRWTSRTTSSL